MKIKTIKINRLSLIVIISLFFVAFNVNAAEENISSSNAGAQLPASVVIDKSGNSIIINKPFKRIISLYAAHTENLFSLGLDKEITGVSKNEAYPPQVMTKAIFSYHDDAEKFIGANPDLILIRPMIARGYGNLVSKLQKAGITVVSLQPTSIDEVFSYWGDLGKLTGKKKEAEMMIRQFQKGIGRIRSLVQTIPSKERKRVYFESIHSKMKTFSPSSIAIFTLKTAGGINIASDAISVRGTNIAAYGKEHILSHASEIDVYLAQRGAMNHTSVERIKKEPGFQAIKAVRDGKIYIIDEKIVSRATLRILDGIHETGRILYPIKFNDITALIKEPVITRAQFAEMFIKMMNVPLKTPDYRRDILKRSGKKHKYGDFKDVDYKGTSYKYIETAVYNGIFYDTSDHLFYPDVPLRRNELAYSLFSFFDFPDTAPVKIRDIKDTDPLYGEANKVVGLGIMKLDKNGRFLPDKPVSGKKVFETLLMAKEKEENK